MKKSGIIKRHVKRKIAAVLLATMLLDQFPVTVYAEPLEWETQAEPAEQEQSAPEEAQPVTEEQTGGEEAQPVADEQTGSEEAAPVADEQTGGEEAKPVADERTGAEETQPAADEQAGSEETAPEEVSEADGEDTVVEAAGTQESVSYKDNEGKTQSHEATVLEGSETSLNPGWYVVNQNITYANSVILNGSGDFHIILTDGKTMNIGTESNPIGGEGMPDGIGLGCSYEDSSKDGIKLHIYAQSSGNSAGKLNIYNNTGSDSDRNEVGDAINVDELTINGGKINLDITGSRSYGINSKKLTINGGDIAATANGMNCHAINSAGNIIINGGNITANARKDVDERDNCGWAIYSEGNLTINDGNVTAQSGGSDGRAVFTGGTFTINSGKLNAVATGSDGVGLNVKGDININGGEIKAESTSYDLDGGFGIDAGSNIAFNGGQVTANGVEAGIRTSGSGKSLSLSWNETTDFIEVNKFSIAGSVTIPAGKAFTDGEKFYKGENANDIKKLKDKKLRPATETLYTVSFNVDGGSPCPPIQVVPSGGKAKEPTEDPSKSGSEFMGWNDTTTSDSYDFNSAVTGNLQLYAHWVDESQISKKIEDCTIQEIYPNKNGDIDPVVWNNAGIKLTKGTDYTSVCERIESTDSYWLTITGSGSESSGYYGIKKIKAIKLVYQRYDTEQKQLVTDTMPEGKTASYVTADTITMNSGWYVVSQNVSVKSRMRVNGDVHLVLCDGATLDAGGNDGTMGISVTEGNSLTIYSQAGNTGKLKASSNEVNWYAGIGGDYPNDGKYPYLGKNKDAGNITIHGGEIIAKGSHDSAAIGKAYGGNGGKITIYGGKITAERYADTYGSGTDTGIGGNGAEIYLSWCRNDDFIKSDGYQGQVTLGKAFRIDGTSTPAKPDNIGGQKIVPTDATENYTVTFDSDGGTAVEPQEVLESTTATKPITPIKQGFRFEYWYKDNSDTSYNFSTPVNGDLTLHAKWTEVGGISFISANGTVNNFKSYSPMVADYKVLPSGYYYVGSDIALAERVKVSGNVSLILGDGKTLTADRGISVMERENTLNIFGQSGGTGVLSAKAEDNDAAIGGDGHFDQIFSGSVGNINIYGGIIRPQGGDDAASIGGGRNNQYYGKICIYGGEISGEGGTDDPALGGSHGAALGSGFAHEMEGNMVNGTVEIRGGKVTVKSNSNGTGIGGGHNAYGGTINILGGQVHVTVSSDVEPGIGDGVHYNGTKKAQITLGCKDQNDFIYSALYSGKVKVAPNQTLIIIDDTSKKFRGDISNLNDITGKKLILGHSHFLTYVVNGGTVTATCNGTGGCDLPDHKATFTLSAPNAADLVYDGTEKLPIVTDEHNISGDEIVHYQKKNGSSWADINAAPKAVGTYRASITLPDTGSGTATAKVEYTISKRPVTISGLAANDKIYDDTTTASVNITAMKLYNMIEGDAVSIVSGNADFDSAEVGKNKKVTFTGYTLTGAAAGNYNLVSQPELMTANIAKRPVTIRANDQAVQYGEAIKEMAASFDLGTDNNDIGILVDRGHALTALTLTPDPDPRTYASPKDDGTITADGAVIKNKNTDSVVTDNYDINYVSGNLKITLLKAKITKLPTVNENLKYEGYLYDQALVNPGEAETKMEYNVQQIVRGDSERVKNKDGDYVDELPAPTEGYSDNYRAWEAGTYRVWFRAASGDDLLAGEPDSVSVNIATVPLKVKVVDEIIPFGERFPSMNAVEEGLVSEWDKGALGMRLYSYLVNGEWKKASDIKITQTYPDLGMYPARISYDMKGYVNYCYRYITSDGYLTVVPRTVSLNWGNVTSFTYDGKPHAPTVTLSNLSKNEVDGAVSAVVAGAQVNAGENYTATVVALSGDKASKYALPDDNTITFSIGKAEYSENIPDVKLDVPCSANFYTTSVAGKMPPDAGKLTYSKGTVSSVGFDITDGFDVKVDQNGLVTVTRKGQQTFPEEKKLDVCVNVDSTNYNRKSITTEATFVNKTDAGVRITSGNSLSVNYSENLPTLTLNAEASHSGTNGTWIWESSKAEVADVSGNNESCTVTVKGVGTAAITAKYDSDTTTGYATLILTVNPISVPVPKAKTGLSYNGTQQTGVESSNIHYTLTGGTGTLPGDYFAIATLTDTKKYRWDDGTIEVKHIPWSIEKQAGPSKPTGLEVVSPTTWANLDGQIKGVSTNMEYSKDPNFSNALPCTGTVIIGLTDGTYYVRVKETEYVKPGAAAEVVVPRVLPPIVRAIQGLVYNGSPQVLVTADTVSEGKIYYAVTGRNDPKPDKGQYSPEIPKKTNAGYYRVWYEIRGAGDPPEEGGVYVDIAQKDLRNVFYYISMSPNGLYGHEGMIDIRARVPEDNPRLRVISADTWGCIKDHPTIDNPKDGATTMRLHYFAARDEELPVTPPGVNRYVSFTVSVDEMVNYHAYNMTIKTTFFKECSTNHADTEPLSDAKAPTCMEKGYTADTWCHDCHGIIKGEDIPIDPDAHDFDMLNGEVTKPPTSLTLGEHTYYCRHNRAHTLVRADIPMLPSDDGVDYTDIPMLPSDDGVDYTDIIEDVKNLSGDAALKQTETTDKETGEVTKTVFVGGDEISKITKDPASGKETVESKIWVAGIAPSYTYTGSRIDPDIHVYDGTRRLEPKTDYTVTYKNDKEPGTAKLLLKFKGNYKGTKEQTINYSIVPAVLGRDILAYDVAVALKDKAQKPLPSLIWASTGKAVSSKFFKVTYDGAESVKKEGTYTAVITSNNKKFEGTMTAKVIVVGKKGYLLSKAKVKFSPKSYVYTGSAIIPAKGSYTLKLGGRQLVEGTDYRPAYVLNNTYPGTATVVFEGMGTGENSPAGTKTATFRITGNRKLEEAGNGSAFTYTYPESIPYAKGGAKPAITIKDNGVTLKEGKDYTLSYSKNKAVTNGEKTALIKVTGKGTYKGSVTLKFKITKQSLNAEGITVEARDQFKTLKKLKKPSVTVIDTNGKKLKAGTDYMVGVMDTSIPGNTDESGQVFIILTGKGNYSSEAPAKTSFRYMAPSANMSRTKTMRSISAQIYTGNAVYLGSKDLSEILYTGSKSAPEYLVYGKDFAVSGYKNNKKKGTAKVTLKGLGSFAGTKPLTFRIAEKKGDYKGVLIGDKWQ